MDFHFYWIQSRDIYDWLVLVCSFALVIVGAWGVKVALSTLSKIERQTKATEDAAIAAKDSAEAARMNAQALIASERPWLVGRFIQNGSEEFTETKRLEFRCEIKNAGETPAILIDAAARAVFKTDAMPLPDEPDFGHAGSLNQRILLPGATYFFWVQAEGYEWKDGRFLLEKNESGKVLDNIMVGFGCVRYRDTFGDTAEHFTRFCDYATTGSKLGILYPKSDMPSCSHSTGQWSVLPLGIRSLKIHRVHIAQRPKAKTGHFRRGTPPIDLSTEFRHT